MATDIEKRLKQLGDRRRGTDRLNRLSEAAQTEVFLKSLTDETWQKRARTQPHTRYALGAMQEVGPEYTQISIDTATRVGKQLTEGLSSMGRSVAFRLQGSVPLNVHIRGVSDVDLLTLDTDFTTYFVAGARARAGLYSPTTERSVDRLLRLRRDIEAVLKSRYPAATIDTSGGKCVAMSGGSLQRPVDVVPSHWLDTIAYQASGLEKDRGVVIVDKKVPETVENLPFLHINLIHERDQRDSMGGLKKAIRLCKNVKNDAIEEGKSINLPSFDLAAIMYHANQAVLLTGAYYELAVLAETQRFLDYLYNDKTFARTLMVPDGSRQIFDAENKFEGLRTLSVEMDELAREVAKEQNALLRFRSEIPFNDARSALERALVAGP